MTERTVSARRWAALATALGAAILAGVLVAACAGSSAADPAASTTASPGAGPSGSGPSPAASPGGGPSGSGSSPAASPGSGSPPAASPSAAAFHSDRYGYRLAVPEGWKATENPGTGGVHPGDPGVDVFTDGRGNTLYIVAELLPTGTSGDGWTSGVARHLEVDHGLTPDGSTNVVVGGLPGRLIDYHLRFDPYVTHELVTQVVRDDRGFAITLEALGGRDADDEALLEALLAGFGFDD